MAFGRSYTASPHMQPWFTGEPGKAPDWYFSTASAAVIWPSFLAPSLTSTTAPEVGPVARNTSSRLMTILTGRPDFFDSRYARSEEHTSELQSPYVISYAVFCLKK